MGRLESQPPVSKASKKHARRKRAHRKAKAVSVICQRCGSLGDGSAGALLTAVADALDACMDAGMDVRLRHGVVMAAGKAGGGYVLPLKDGRWTARTLAYDPFVQVSVLPDDLDD
jgi:hypothetical protein